MDRFARFTPWALTLTLFTLAVLGMRWATGPSDCGNTAVTASETRPCNDVPAILPTETDSQFVLTSTSAPSAVPEMTTESVGPALAEPAAVPIETPTAAVEPAQLSADAARPTANPPRAENSKTPTVESEIAGDGTAAKAFASNWPLSKKVAALDEKGMKSENGVKSEEGEESAKGEQGDGGRSAQLEQVAQQADRRTRQGFELAGRGAYFAARSEFLGALRLVAAGLDTEEKTNTHRSALTAAVTALREAEDFLPGESRTQTDDDLAALITLHDTPVLKGQVQGKTPLSALRSYLTYAQDQFAAAADREVAGSMALYAMGKLHDALSQKKAIPIASPESKAVVFYQAALRGYPENFMAANDLGVLLGRCGNDTDARAMLEYSLSVRRQPTGLQNLAVIYKRLGQTARSEQAAREAAQLALAEAAKNPTATDSTQDVVRWVEPEALAKGLAAANPSSPIVAASSAATESVRLRPPVRPGATATRLPPVPRVAAVVQPSVPKVRTPSVTFEPAATPAAAERRLWGDPAYQR
jgi:hypothetical protein